MKIAFVPALALAFALSIAPARADEYVVLDQRADEFDRWDAPFDERSGPITIISRETGLPETVIVEQHSRTQLGYGGLLIANALATETGRSFDEIVALKTSGHGWGWIAKENNVKLGPIISRFHRADGDFRKIKVKTKNGETKIKVKEAKGNGGGPKSKGDKGKEKAQGGGHGKGHGGGKGKH